MSLDTYDWVTHRHFEKGYLNRDIQESFALAVAKIALRLEIKHRLTGMFLVGKGNSGMALGTTCHFLYPSLVRYVPWEHNENFENLSSYPPQKIVFIDDYIFKGGTLNSVNSKVNFANGIVIGVDPNYVKPAGVILHILTE